MLHLVKPAIYHTGWGPQSIAFSCLISVAKNGRSNELVTGRCFMVYKPTYNWGTPSFSNNGISWWQTMGFTTVVATIISPGKFESFAITHLQNIIEPSQFQRSQWFPAMKSRIEKHTSSTSVVSDTKCKPYNLWAPSLEWITKQQRR